MPVITVDFTDVESGGYLAPGTYRAQVESVRQQDGRNYPGLKFTWASIEPETEGQRADMFVSLAPQALWVLKGILEAFGAEIPQSAMRFDTDRLIGKKAMIKVFHEPWTDSEGKEKMSSKVDRVFPIQKTETQNEIHDPDFAPAEPDGSERYGEDDDIPF